MLPLLLAVTDTTSTSACTVNGQPADCGQVLPILGAVFIPLLLIGLVCMVFWVITLIHAIKHPDVPNRVLWIILHFILLGPLAGPIYFFAVKRPYDKGVSTVAAPPTAPTAPPAPPAPPVA